MPGAAQALVSGLRLRASVVVGAVVEHAVRLRGFAAVTPLQLELLDLSARAAASSLLSRIGAAEDHLSVLLRTS
jgi:hypothetical protein